MVNYYEKDSTCREKVCSTEREKKCKTVFEKVHLVSFEKANLSFGLLISDIRKLIDNQQMLRFLLMWILTNLMIRSASLLSTRSVEWSTRRFALRPLRPDVRCLQWIQFKNDAGYLWHRPFGLAYHLHPHPTCLHNISGCVRHSLPSSSPWSSSSSPRGCTWLP